MIEVTVQSLYQDLKDSLDLKFLVEAYKPSYYWFEVNLHLCS